MKFLKKRIFSSVILIAILLAACNSAAISPTTTPSLPAPVVNTTQVPDSQKAVTEFLELWKKEDYTAMYDRLNQVSRDAIPLEDFLKKYKDAAISLTLQTLDYQIQSVLTEISKAQVAYTLVYHTALFQDIKTSTEMMLTLEGGAWKVQWDDAIIFAELKGGNRLSLDAKVPSRGNIYDRNGQILAGQTEAYAIGIVPGEINSTSNLLNELSNLTGKTEQAIKALYKDAAPDWYIPIGEASAQQVTDRLDQLKSAGGIRLSPYNTRFYYDGGAAAQVLGYTLFISKDEMESFRRKGYKGDERFGAAGIEKWGDAYLTGKIGGDLYVVAPDGAIITRVASAPSMPAQDIYTTLDKDLQLLAEKAIEGWTGAIVVMERDTGRVLAMVSSPDFDPNLLDPNNINTTYIGNEVYNNPLNPFLNRAAQSSYPPGSVFKVIPMAAALESDLYTKDTTYKCESTFTELPGDPLYDWTYEKKLPPSGVLTLPEGLMRSCNPYFWHIGLDLYRQNRPKDISNMARAFGLGQDTGIDAVAEDTGSIPDPSDEGDAVQLAIGQGTMLVTPLQVANYFSALGSSGKLYRPQIIEKITTLDGTPSLEFKVETRSTLPVKPDNLQVIIDGLRMVVSAKRGTARPAFAGLSIPVYGKTGTAQNPNGDPHAWFGGFTDAKSETKPDIAMVVFVENGGEGSERAAPIFRRVVEDYFFGGPGKLYPWESSYYVTRTPTSPVTPTPEGTPAP